MQHASDLEIENRAILENHCAKLQTDVNKFEGLVADYKDYLFHIVLALYKTACAQAPALKKALEDAAKGVWDEIKESGPRRKIK